MKLKGFEIIGYRSCLRTRLPLDKELTGLIGINGAGKSNLLSAILLLHKSSELIYSTWSSEESAINKCLINATLLHNNKEIYISGEVFFETNEKNVDEIKRADFVCDISKYIGAREKIEIPLGIIKSEIGKWDSTWELRFEVSNFLFNKKDVETNRLLKIIKDNRSVLTQVVNYLKGINYGKIIRKCKDWAESFKRKGCSVMIIVHDLDNKKKEKLLQIIGEALYPSPISKHLICIPIQEYEAWLLSDPTAIKKAMKLQKLPNVKGMPENVNSPKEELGKLIKRASDGAKEYINTKHNAMITKELSINQALSRCNSSFAPFYDFVKSNV